MTEHRLNEFQLGTAIRLYLRDVHGIPFSAVGEVRLPVFTGAGDPFAVVEVDPDIKPPPLACRTPTDAELEAYCRAH